MNGYLLLRDNKQSGPYSAEEMIAKGFKPYDLIWAEGKSAGWRYPSELPEFASHAPIVEEQPYDRFYKKPAATSPTYSPDYSAYKPAYSNNAVPEVKQPVPDISTRVSAFTTANTTEIPAAPVTVVEQVTQRINDIPNPSQPLPVEQQIAEPVKTYTASKPNNPSGKIFVTMPGSRQAIPEQREPAHIPTPVPQVNESAYMPRQEAPVQIPAPVPDYDPPKQEPAPEKDSRAKESIQQPTYTSFKQSQQFLADHAQRTVTDETLYIAPARQKNTTRAFMLGAFAACLLLGGVIIGLLISNNQQSQQNEQLNAGLKKIQDRNAGKHLPDQQAELTQPVTNGIPQEPGNTSKDPATGAETKPNSEISQQAVNKTTPEQPDRSNVVNAVQKNTAPPIDKPANETDEVAEKNDDIKPVTPPATDAARKSIYELVSVSGSDYKTGLLGGVSKLQLTITNNSLYPVDQVEVLVNYLNMDKKLVKQQTVVITEVPAGEQKTVEVPKTNRGVYVTYTIKKINSRALGLAQSGL